MGNHILIIFVLSFCTTAMLHVLERKHDLFSKIRLNVQCSMLNGQRLRLNDLKQTKQKTCRKVCLSKGSIAHPPLRPKKAKTSQSKTKFLISKPFLRVESRNVGKRNTGCGSLVLPLFLPAQGETNSICILFCLPF